MIKFLSIIEYCRQQKTPYLGDIYGLKWSQMSATIRRPAVYKTAALPTELIWQSVTVLYTKSI